MEWLGTPEFGVDEVAFEVRGEHPGTSRARRASGVSDCGNHHPENGWCTRDRRRAEGRHTVARQPLCKGGNRVRPVERVDAVQPVHVDVDEPRHHYVAVQGDVADAPAGTGRAHRPTSHRRAPTVHDAQAAELAGSPRAGPGVR